MVTKPLLLAAISVCVFGAAIVGLKAFIFWRTGEFDRIDLIEVATLIVVAFIWPFLFRSRG